MKVSPSLFLHTLLLAVFSISTAEDTIVPSAQPISRYTREWGNSAFHREVVKAVETRIASDFAQAIVLEGLIDDEVTGPIAFLRDTEKETTFMITKKQTEGVPYWIVKANPSNDPEASTIEMTDGTESGRIGFKKSMLTQAIRAPVATQPKPNDRNSGRKPGVNIGGAIRQPPGGTNLKPVTPQVGQPKSQPAPANPQEDLTAEERMENRSQRRKVPPPSG